MKALLKFLRGRKLPGMGVLLLLGVLLSGPVWAAGGGYSPTGGSDVGTSVPGGYQSILVAKTIPGGHAEQIVITLGQLTLTLNIPAQAFQSSTTIVVSSPRLSSLASGLAALGYRHDTIVTAFGVGLDNSQGNAVVASSPIRAQLAGSSLTTVTVPLEFQTPQAVIRVPRAVTASQEVSFTFRNEHDFVFVNPATIPTATSPVTGEPFLWWGLAGLVLIGSGATLATKSVGTQRNR